MDSDNNIAAFCAVTGADADAARVYLALADASLDAAIALFLDNPLLAASATTTSSNRNNNNDHNRPLLSANNVAGVDDDDVYVDADDDDDVEFVSSTNQQQELQQDFVRAAIKPKHDTLVGNDFSYFDEHSLAQRPLGVRGRAAPRATQEKSGFDGAFALASSQTGASSSNPRANKLAKLFATPYDIMFNGGFDTAREVARELSKWILVTVSDRTEFACETQKRDLWNVGDVKEIISANFVFLFFPSESDDAKHHMSFYKVSGFPYIAIIDPRTGESMKTWYNSPKKEEFLSDLALFLDSYSLENFRAVNKRKAESSVGDLTEEEQLNLAIAASLNASAKSELDVKMAEASSPGCEIVDEWTLIPASVAPEPASFVPASEIAKVQFKLPDGSRILRKFVRTDVVKVLFSFVKSIAAEKEIRGKFELLNFRDALSKRMTETLESAKVPNSTLTVELLS